MIIKWTCLRLFTRRSRPLVCDSEPLIPFMVQQPALPKPAEGGGHNQKTKFIIGGLQPSLSHGTIVSRGAACRDGGGLKCGGNSDNCHNTGTQMFIFLLCVCRAKRGLVDTTHWGDTPGCGRMTDSICCILRFWNARHQSSHFWLIMLAESAWYEWKQPKLKEPSKVNAALRRASCSSDLSEYRNPPSALLHARLGLIEWGSVFPVIYIFSVWIKIMERGGYGSGDILHGALLYVALPIFFVLALIPVSSGRTFYTDTCAPTLTLLHRFGGIIWGW